MSPFPRSLAHTTSLPLAGFLCLAEQWLLRPSRTKARQGTARSRPLPLPQASAVAQGLPLNMSDHSCYLQARSPSHLADRHIVGCKLAPALQSRAVPSKLSPSSDFPRDSSRGGSSKCREKLARQSLLRVNSVCGNLAYHHMPGPGYNYFKHRVASNHATVYGPKSALGGNCLLSLNVLMLPPHRM